MEPATDPPEEIHGVCGCGRPLLVTRDANGKRIGVTHTPDDEDHHLGFWRDTRVLFLPDEEA